MEAYSGPSKVVDMQMFLPSWAEAIEVARVDRKTKIKVIKHRILEILEILAACYHVSVPTPLQKTTAYRNVRVALSKRCGNHTVWA